MKKPPPNQPERYQELLKAAAAKHRTALTDSRAVHEAGVRFLHESLTARMVAGENIDPNAFMKISEALQAILPPPEPIKVQVQIMDPPKTKCPDCGCEFNPEGVKETPAPPRQIDGQAVEAPQATKALPAPTTLKTAANAKPAAPPPRQPDPVGNHGAACWTGYMGRAKSFDPAPTDPHPYRDQTGHDRY
jgi:hypothetical protein